MRKRLVLVSCWIQSTAKLQKETRGKSFEQVILSILEYLIQNRSLFLLLHLYAYMDLFKWLCNVVIVEFTENLQFVLLPAWCWCIICRLNEELLWWELCQLSLWLKRFASLLLIKVLVAGSDEESSERLLCWSRLQGGFFLY